jgi:hypothetical protein
MKEAEWELRRLKQLDPAKDTPGININIVRPDPNESAGPKPRGIAFL